MRAYKIYASYLNDNDQPDVPCYICIFMYLLYVRNTQKRRSIVKEVEVDRETVAKSVPILAKYIQKHFEGHRTARYH